VRILIFGGDGMLGHRLYRHLSDRHDVRVTLRNRLDAYRAHGVFSRDRAFDRVEATSPAALEAVVEAYRPEAMINAIGVVKQRHDVDDAIRTIEINSLLPHRLARLAREYRSRLIHLSTDCVFSGRRGCYSEDDLPDPVDLYGRSKLLGEPSAAPALTLRTSMIGPELARKSSLYEWFLAQHGPVKGYRKAVFSGFTTHELARVIARVIERFPEASGLFHLAAPRIDKYALLTLIRDKLGLATRIEPDDAFECDRSLDGSRFNTTFAYEPPSWDAMIDELARERSD
jgi:dTDP-4-dehydrorhamnose reductase